MDITNISDNTRELKSKLRVKYPQLTESDMEISNNNVKQMITMVAYKLRKSKEEFDEIIKKL